MPNTPQSIKQEHANSIIAKKKEPSIKRDLIKIVVVGITFHLMAIMSIFDIYFKSPLSHGQTPVEPSLQAPARRLVFIVGDGLRADKCFHIEADGKPRAPFLHQIAANSGTFGVSHTRVPTESRPGHVAMIAGFNEDPSAVTRGWKENPVMYDHFLKRARWAFSFGAPEIISLFPGDNVSSHSYPKSYVDFGLGRDILKQDEWPFQKLYELFSRAKTDIQLNDKLREDKVLFFIHLLGHDTNGHAYGPQSEEYSYNTRFIDGKIEEFVQKLRNFYNDDRTAFVFTADHGMSDGRSHGDGHPDNTRTPLIVWGAGVSAPEADPDGVSHADGFSKNWGQLSKLRRRDARQCDLAPLVSSLVGITIPVQSEGQLPVEYLTHGKYRKEAVIRNTQQLLENYRVKEEKERQKHVWWIPFWPFDQLSHFYAAKRLHDIVNIKDPSKAIEESYELMAGITQGISYINNYDQSLLFFLLSISYAGWIVFGLLAVIKLYTAFGRFYIERGGIADRAYLVPICCLVILCSVLFGRSAPLHYYIYAFFPVWFLKQFLQSRDLFSILRAQAGLIFDSWSTRSIFKHLIVNELIVGAYFDRRAMSIIYGSLGLLGKPLDYNALMLSIFTLLAPIKDPNRLLYIAGSIWGFSILLKARMHVTCLVQSIALLSALVTDYSITTKRGLPIYCQMINWSILLYCACSLSFNRRKSLKFIFGQLLPPITILSISYEVAFFTCFFLYIEHWLNKLDGPKEKKENWIRVKDIVQVTEFLAAINMAFFGTGNIASLSSFSLPSVYRLVTAFRPFLMATILIAKQLLPVVLLSAGYTLVARKCNLPGFSLLLLAIALIDAVTIHFFFLVTNVGSWLEIGMGISRFVIANVFILIVLMMYGIGEVLLL